MLKDDVHRRQILPFHTYLGGDRRDRIYGRSGEESILMNSYYSSLSLNASSPANVVLISGDSGVGKTKLAETLRFHALDDDGYFICGKFDQRGGATPYSGITSAFGDYCSQLEQRKDDREQVLRALREEIQSDEGKILSSAMPSLIAIFTDSFNESYFGRKHATGNNLHDILGDGTPTQNNFHRLSYLLQKFVGVISSMGDPIIFLLDDVQWADACSLDLLLTLARSAKNPFVFIFTYRPVGNDHPFLQLISALEASNHVTEIRLRGLSDNDVHTMVSNRLVLNQVKDLSEFLCRVTKGNPLHVQQQITSLLDDGLIHVNGNELVWELETVLKSDTTISSDVVVMASLQIKRLSFITQSAVTICASIGSKINYEVLGILIRAEFPDDKLVNDAETKVAAKNVLLPAIQHDLLIETQNGTSFEFVHDCVQSAAYSLILIDDRAAFHLKLGRILMSELCAVKLSQYLFIVAHQLAKGSELISENDRLKIAQIIVRAGNESKGIAAIREAFYFYAKTIDIMCSRDWNDNYRFCCDVYLKAIEVAIWSGEFDFAEKWLDKLCWFTRNSVHDTLRAHALRITMIAGRGNIEAAVNLGMRSLFSLGPLVGVKVSPKNLKLGTLVGLIKTRRLMSGQNERTLLNRPCISDDNKTVVIDCLDGLAMLCITTLPKMAPLMMFKIIEMNMKFGMSSTMPAALAWYGTLLDYFGFSFYEAAKYCDLAKCLHQHLNCNGKRAQLTFICYTRIFTLTKKFHDCLQSIYDGHVCGLKAGNLYEAMGCALLHGTISFYSGQKLVDVDAELKNFSRSMKIYNTPTTLHIIQIYEQAVSYLNDSSVQAPDSDFFDLKIDGTRPFFMVAVTVKLLVAYTFDDFTTAWNMTGSLRNTVLPRPFSVIAQYVSSFFQGMTALALAQQRMPTPKKRHLKKVIRSSLATVKRVSMRSPVNFSHYYSLLEAENAVFQRKFEFAEQNFSVSIEHASKNGVTQMNALACERFGHYYFARGNHSAAKEQLERAHSLYSLWGARAKCRLMEKKFEGFLITHAPARTRS